VKQRMLVFGENEFTARLRVFEVLEDLR
jgi:hypothetical protein